MSTEGANTVGKMLAIVTIIAALGFAIGAASFGISFLFNF